MKRVQGQEKKAVRVGLEVRYDRGEAELYPVYGKLYAEGYAYAFQQHEDLFVTTEPVEVSLRLSDSEAVAYLQELGFEVYTLQPDGTLEQL